MASKFEDTGMGSIMKCFASALFTFCLVAGSAWAGDVPDAFAEVEKLITKSVERGRVPAVSVSVIQHGRLVWAGGYGTAQFDTDTTATADTPYILASVSKPITATGLMRLVDRGDVSLDAPVNTYLGDGQVRAHVGRAADMTVRRLANHTSGMPTHWNFFYHPNMPPAMDQSISRYAFGAWAPGTRTNYSNLAFGILNYLTERVSGTDWGAFMEAEVYDPTGMSHTSHRIRPGLEGIAAHSYSKDSAGRWVRVTPYAFDHPGASAIWSSANDLAKFLMLHMNRGTVDGSRILSETAADEMQRVHADAKAAGSNYGVAWNISSVNGVKQISHGGGMPGVSTRIAAYPEIGAAYAVLTNGDGHNISSRVAAELRKVLLPKPSEKDAESSGTDGADKKDKDNGPQLPLGEWTGHVVDSGSNIELEVRFRKEKGVFVRLGTGGQPSKKAEAVFNGDRLNIAFPGRFGSYPHFHGETKLQLELLPNDDSLRGVLYVIAPGYFRLPYYAELTRAE